MADQISLVQAHHELEEELREIRSKRSSLYEALDIEESGILDTLTLIYLKMTPEERVQLDQERNLRKRNHD